MAEFVTLEVSEGIGTIRLARPPMNALNRQVQDELAAAAHAATVDKAVKAVIVYGGEKVFAAGADVKEMAEMDYGQIRDAIGGMQAGLGAVASIPKRPLPRSPDTHSAVDSKLHSRPIAGSSETMPSSEFRRFCSESFPVAAERSVWLV